MTLSTSHCKFVRACWPIALCVALAGAAPLRAMDPFPNATARVSFERGQFDEGQKTAFVRGLEGLLAGARQRLGLPGGRLRTALEVYATAEAKVGAIGGREGDSEITFGEQGELALLTQYGSGAIDARGPVLALLREAWGKPGWDAVAAGIARYGAGEYRGRSTVAYARQIACEERPYSLYDVFRDDDLYLSSYVRDALAGAWIASVVERYGAAVLPSLYRAAEPNAILDRLGITAPEVEGQWESWLTSQPCAAPAKRSRVQLDRYWRGVNFSHEPGRWRGQQTPATYTGYGSETAMRELQQLREMGANAVSLIPYAFSGAPGELTIRFNLDERNDRVERSIHQAHSLGLAVMLKPQVWARRTFTGDVRFERREDFDQWWRHYRRGLLHYARMAELLDVEILVVGTEWEGLMGYEDAWRGLIADVRRVYSGSITYAANWGREFEELPFTDALDYAGVDFYYPLAQPGETPSAKSARAQELAKLLDAHYRRTGKPILFTEVGYPALDTAASEPWKEPDTALDPAMQAACYATTIGAFDGQPYMAGMFWWKWLSHGGDGRARRGGFHPHGNPAMALLREFFSRPGKRSPSAGGQLGLER